MTFQRHSKIQLQNYLQVILIYSSMIANKELDSLVKSLLANKRSLSIGIDKNENKDNLPNLRLLGHNLPRPDYVKYIGVLLADCLTF